MNELVCVGGGPVGIWTAIQIKKRKPSVNVTVYERFETYQRSHVLRLDYWSLTLYAKVFGDEYENIFLNNVVGKTMQEIKLKPTKSAYIRTNDLEAALKQYAEKLGINVVYRKASDIEEIEALHPDCTHFIAADGANSSFRKQLIGEEDIEKIPLQYIVEMKYTVNQKTSKINFKEIIEINSQNEFMGFEYIGKFKNNSCPISVRFFIDEQVYKKLPEATFKNPLSLEAIKSDNNLNNLNHTITQYLGFRHAKFNDDIDYQNIRISKLPLYLYAAKKFAIKRESKIWFLTGDAALGVPYFRSLNSGLLLGSRLAQIMTSSINKLGNPVAIQYSTYNFHRVLHIQTEFNIARGKDIALRSFNKIRKLSLK